MTKQEVIERFCQLSATVGNHLHNEYAHDCFCHKSLSGDFQFNAKIIEFIENAVDINMQ